MKSKITPGRFSGVGGETDPAILPEMRDFLDLLGAGLTTFDPSAVDVEAFRKAAAVARQQLGDEMPDLAEVLSIDFATSWGTVPARLFRPHGPPHGPALVYLHGGGFVIGSLDSGDGVAWGIADEVGAVVVSVDYRLAPEHPFPAGAEDCYAALCYVAEHPREFGIDAARIAIWGDSAGGNLTVATCLIARDRGGPPIVAHAAVYPVLTAPGLLPSHAKYADSPGLTSSFMEEAWGSYVGANDDGDEPYAAPLKAPDLSRMPPAHVHIAEIDPLADDGREYVRRLLEAGGDAELHCARRMIHGFARARHSGPDAAVEFAAICRSLRAHLST